MNKLAEIEKKVTTSKVRDLIVVRYKANGIIINEALPLSSKFVDIARAKREVAKKAHSLFYGKEHRELWSTNH